MFSIGKGKWYTRKVFGIEEVEGIMKIIRSIAEMQKETLMHKENKRSIGFAPTMGYFHKGHLQLIEEAKKENDIVAVSIFVNPLQFGENEDFGRYPRDEKRDIQLAESYGVDLLFIPTVEEMYPTKPQLNMVMVDRVDVLCGKSRPGHFDGVVTVLAKLFHIVQPNRAYFGLKDAQQIAVVDVLIQQYNFPIELIRVPTAREDNGLAMSSRNVYLTEQERAEAPAIIHALQEAKSLMENEERHPAVIVEKVRALLQQHTSAKIDYVELLSYPELKTIEQINQQVIVAVAVQFEKARLIDNIIYHP